MGYPLKVIGKNAGFGLYDPAMELASKFLLNTSLGNDLYVAVKLLASLNY